jgi:hypothetical protein
MVVSFWDSFLAEYKCVDFTFMLPSVDGSGNDVNSFFQVKMPTATMAQVKTRVMPANTYTVFDINQVAADNSASNVHGVTLSITNREVSTGCTTDGHRTYLPLQVNA